MSTPRDVARDVDVRRQQLEALHERLVDEVRRIRTGSDWKAWLDVAARFHTYSFRNIILIAAQRPDATKVAGYTTWKELGHQVNKGEKGIAILAPVFRRPDPPSQDRDSLAEMDADAVREARRGTLVGVRRTYVWDISQTTGPDLPAPPVPQPLDGPAPAGLWDDLAEQVTRAGYTLHREPLGPDQADGYTHYAGRRVVVAERLARAEAVLTLAHEVAHMLMHAPTDFTNQSTAGCRGTREVEAESVAYLIATHHGLNADRASFPYVATWAHTADRDAPEEAVQEAGQRVIATTRIILSQLVSSTANPDELGRTRAFGRVRVGTSPQLDPVASNDSQAIDPPRI